MAAARREVARGQRCAPAWKRRHLVRRRLRLGEAEAETKEAAKARISELERTADAIAHKLEQKCDDNAKLQMDLCKLEEEMSNTVANHGKKHFW